MRLVVWFILQFSCSTYFYNLTCLFLLLTDYMSSCELRLEVKWWQAAVRLLNEWNITRFLKFRSGFLPPVCVPKGLSSRSTCLFISIPVFQIKSVDSVRSYYTETIVFWRISQVASFAAAWLQSKSVVEDRAGWSQSVSSSESFAPILAGSQKCNGPKLMFWGILYLKRYSYNVVAGSSRTVEPMPEGLHI